MRGGVKSRTLKGSCNGESGYSDFHKKLEPRDTRRSQRNPLSSRLRKPTKFKVTALTANLYRLTDDSSIEVMSIGRSECAFFEVRVCLPLLWAVED